MYISSQLKLLAFMHTMLVLFLFRGLSASEPPAEADDRATQKAAESTVIEEVCGTIFQVRADLPDSILDGSDLRGVSGVQITHFILS